MQTVTKNRTAPKRKLSARTPGGSKPEQPADKPEGVTDREWEQFLKAIDSCTVEWVLCTPTLAQEWLDLNKKNRKLSGTAVSFYANQIKPGGWMINGQTVIFGKNGNMLDGQHRLAAAIQAGKAIPLLVVRGVDNDAFKTIDRNRARSIADVLHIAGETTTTILASACRFLESFQRTGHFGKGKGRIAYAEIEEILRQNPNLRISAAFAISGITKDFPLGSPSMIAACHYMFSSIDDENCAYFFDRLQTGAELAKDSPILQLRKIVINNRNSLQKYPLDTLGRFLVKTWNLFCLGETKQTLKVEDREDLTLLERPRGSIHSRGKN
jgi:hypothetical protein